MPFLDTLTVGLADIPHRHAITLNHALRMLADDTPLTATGENARDLGAHLAAALRHHTRATQAPPTA